MRVVSDAIDNKLATLITVQGWKIMALRVSECMLVFYVLISTLSYSINFFFFAVEPEDDDGEKFGVGLFEINHF